MSHPIERDCPKCGAVIGQPCTGKYGRERKSYHRARGSRQLVQPVYSDAVRQAESPIEEALIAAIEGWLDHHFIDDAWVETQVPFGPYRADIMVKCAGKSLVVECDGDRFHNTPAAIAHDKRRDRFCVVHGIAVMRFTGHEIRRDPRGCAAQVGLWVRAQR